MSSLMCVSFFFLILYQVSNKSQILGVSLSQQSFPDVPSKVSCHPPVLIFLVSIPSTSEDVGNRFCLADTSLNRAGAWKGCTLNSRFFRPVVSIPHASPRAKHSSCSCLLSHLTGTMWCCTCPHFADPSCLRLFFFFFLLRRLFDVSTIIVDSSSPSCSYPTLPRCRASGQALRNSSRISNICVLLLINKSKAAGRSWQKISIKPSPLSLTLKTKSWIQFWIYWHAFSLAWPFVATLVNSVIDKFAWIWSIL